MQPRLSPNKGRDDTSGATLSNGANKANIVSSRASVVTVDMKYISYTKYALQDSV